MGEEGLNNAKALSLFRQIFRIQNELVLTKRHTIYGTAKLLNETMENPAYLFNPRRLRNRLIKLHEKRKASKQPAKRTKRLTKSERAEVLSKTDGKCHICGQKLSVDKFQADHVVSHVRGGQHHVDNYLPACFVCNNYRWHYLPEELQLILKLGVWAKTEIEKGTALGEILALKFAAKEHKRNEVNSRIKQ